MNNLLCPKNIPTTLHLEQVTKVIQNEKQKFTIYQDKQQCHIDHEAFFRTPHVVSSELINLNKMTSLYQYTLKMSVQCCEKKTLCEQVLRFRKFM